VLGNTNDLKLYDSSLSLLSSVRGSLMGFGPDFPLDGGVLFSADSTKLYEVGVYNNLAVVLTIDAATLKVLGGRSCRTHRARSHKRIRGHGHPVRC
jgi:hypothetical protein